MPCEGILSWISIPTTSIQSFFWLHFSFLPLFSSPYHQVYLLIQVMMLFLQPAPTPSSKIIIPCCVTWHSRNFPIQEPKAFPGYEGRYIRYLTYMQSILSKFPLQTYIDRICRRPLGLHLLSLSKNLCRKTSTNAEISEIQVEINYGHFDTTDDRFDDNESAMALRIGVLSTS